MECPKCGELLSPVAQQCPRCQRFCETSVPFNTSSSPSRVRCQLCGRALASLSSFCPDCDGASVVTDAREYPATTPTPRRKLSANPDQIPLPPPSLDAE